MGMAVEATAMAALTSNTLLLLVPDTELLSALKEFIALTVTAALAVMGATKGKCGLYCQSVAASGT